MSSSTTSFEHSMFLGRASTAKASIRISGYLIASCAATALALATAGECQSITHLPSLLYGVVLWWWWGSIAIASWKIAERRPSTFHYSFKTLPVHLLLASALGIAHLLLLWSLGYIRSGWAKSHDAETTWAILLNWNRFGMELLLYGFVFGIVGIVQYRVRAQKAALHALALQEQLSTAHLRALQMQLEPHFLFNTLNTIATLVELGRQTQAAEMLGHLNAILKSTLQRSTPEKVPLSQELEIVENYLAIEQVRFADRLRLSIRIAPDALDGLVPCFLLQPIVENAIRHGISHCEDEGLIEASAVRNGDFLHVHIRDTGVCGDNVRPNGHGIGLKNTRDRLIHFYRDNFLMHAQPLAAGGFEVSITLPYERKGR